MKNKSLLKGIDYAYNTKKFKAESHVKFNFDLKISDTSFFRAMSSLKPMLLKLKFKILKIDKILTAKQLNSDFDKTLF